MNKIFATTLFILGFLMMETPAFSSGKQDSLIVDYGQVEIYQREIDHAKIEEYRKQAEFNYNFEEVKNLSLWEQFIYLIKKWLRYLSESLGILWYFRFVFLGALILFFIWIIYRSKLSGLFRPSHQTPTIHFDNLTNPESVDWEQEIEKAIQQKEFRLAVRYHFLAVLKKLNQAGLIQWKSEKTNFDYIRELSDAKIRNEFFEISKLYEAIWYGNFSIQEQEYTGIDRDFKSFGTLFQNQ